MCGTTHHALLALLLGILAVGITVLTGSRWVGLALVVGIASRSTARLVVATEWLVTLTDKRLRYSPIATAGRRSAVLTVTAWGRSWRVPLTATSSLLDVVPSV